MMTVSLDIVVSSEDRKQFLRRIAFVVQANKVVVINDGFKKLEEHSAELYQNYYRCSAETSLLRKMAHPFEESPFKVDKETYIFEYTKIKIARNLALLPSKSASVQERENQVLAVCVRTKVEVDESCMPIQIVLDEP